MQDTILIRKSEKNSRFVEMDIMRVLCTVLLLVLHATTIYRGGWSLPNGIGDVELYYWVSSLCNSVMLPMWVFICGYIYYYQKTNSNREYNLKSLISKKTKRLVLPGLFWSGLYIVLFTSKNEWFEIKTLFTFMSGAGHLWFLIMLFWLFLFYYILSRFSIFLKTNDVKLTICLLLISILSINVKSFGVGGALYYLLFFHFGYITHKYKNHIIAYAITLKILVVESVIYVALFVYSTKALQDVYLMSHATLSERIWQQVNIHVLEIPTATFGILICYGVIMRFVSFSKIYSKLNALASYSFGIYIIHQFVLIGLFYHTSLPMYLGKWLLPVVGILVAVPISIFFTKIGRKNHILSFIIK